jgi:ATP-dependent DNA helicase RecG
VIFPNGLEQDPNNMIEVPKITGPVPSMIKNTLEYLRTNIVKERIIKPKDRAESERFFNYPYEAIEETLANAVYHKGYNEREPIEVRVLPDRIEIVSYPVADRSITMDGLKNYRVFNRRYRNRRIGEFLKELHLTEGRNTGFGKILRALEKNGSPKPLFETDDERTSFAATIYIHPEFCKESIDSSADQTTDQTDQTTDQTTNQDNKGADQDNQETLENRILGLIRNNPQVTQVQISEYLNVPKSTVKYYIGKMTKAQILQRDGTKRTGKWTILK